MDLERQKRKKTRKGIPQGISWKFNFHHFTKLNNSFEKKISSEHCIRRIICTQMVILICKMSVILSEIPVSVSPYYNPNVSFISLSSFKNYDPQLEKILLKTSQQNCILCTGNTVELSSCCCCCLCTWIGCLLVVLLFLSKELCHTNFQSSNIWKCHQVEWNIKIIAQNIKSRC